MMGQKCHLTADIVFHVPQLTYSFSYNIPFYYCIIPPSKAKGEFSNMAEGLKKIILLPM